jgi:hypothetical protein
MSIVKMDSARVNRITNRQKWDHMQSLVMAEREQRELKLEQLDREIREHAGTRK